MPAKYLQSSFLAPPPPPHRAWEQQKNNPQELKKQQNRSMATNTIKITAITMPAMAPELRESVVASGSTATMR